MKDYIRQLSLSDEQRRLFDLFLFKKIRIKNKEKYKQVLSLAFRCGYTWANGSTNIFSEDDFHQFLFFSSYDNYPTGINSVRFGDREDCFYEDKNDEIEGDILLQGVVE